MDILFLHGFLQNFSGYFLGILPFLLLGFFLSGMISEFLPPDLISSTLGGRGIKPVFYAALAGMFLPVCCWGVLPIAVTLHRGGARVGPVLAFMSATPATSASALLVSYRLLGPRFAIFEFFGVMVLGTAIGLIGNLFKSPPGAAPAAETCPSFAPKRENSDKVLPRRIKSLLRFAFIRLPKDIGPEIVVGIAIAALILTLDPEGRFVSTRLAGGAGYAFSAIFGLVMYVCATAAVPLVDAFISQGLSAGAGMVLLLFGPVTSYGTILVLKKQYGWKILAFYVASAGSFSTLLGILFGAYF